MTTEAPEVGVAAGPRAAEPASAGRRVDGSMSLLVDVMTHTLDEAYAERAARARAVGPRAPDGPRPHRRRRTTPLVGLVAVGLLTGTAVAEVRERSRDDQGLRSSLAAEVDVRTRRTDELASEVARLRDEVASVRQQALSAGAAGRATARRLDALSAASATSAVRGPGVVVTLDDAPTGPADGSDPLRGGSVPESRVGDADLQDVVNGLWAAGAEAVAVDGQRLTALSAIRSVGESILIDLRPSSPPYVVEAVGDPARLEVGFGGGPSGQRLETLRSLYGIVSSVRRADELTLRGSATPVLRHAEPVAGALTGAGADGVAGPGPADPP